MRILLLLLGWYATLSYANDEAALISGSWRCIDDGPKVLSIENITYLEQSFESDIFVSLRQDQAGDAIAYKTQVGGRWELQDKKIRHHVDTIQVVALNDSANTYVREIKQMANTANSYESTLHEVSHNFMSFWSSSQRLIYCYSIVPSNSTARNQSRND